MRYDLQQLEVKKFVGALQVGLVEAKVGDPSGLVFHAMLKSQRESGSHFLNQHEQRQGKLGLGPDHIVLERIS